jgi:hypothetical protein
MNTITNTLWGSALDFFFLALIPFFFLHEMTLVTMCYVSAHHLNLSMTLTFLTFLQTTYIYTLRALHHTIQEPPLLAIPHLNSSLADAVPCPDS